MDHLKKKALWQFSKADFLSLPPKSLLYAENYQVPNGNSSPLLYQL